MVQEATNELLDDVDGFKELDELQCVNFSCSIPAVTGRGFIEVLFFFVLGWGGGVVIYCIIFSLSLSFFFFNSSNSAASNLYLICLE